MAPGGLLNFGFDNIELWRSEEMQLVQLMVPAESAHDTIGALGDVGLLQFKDLNADKSAFQRTYANQVKRCDEMARKIRFFHDQVEKAGLAVGVRTMDKAYDLDELEGKLEELEGEMLEVNGNSERLARSYAELVELQLVLEKAGSFFDQARVDAQAENLDRAYSVPEDMGAPLLESALPVENKAGRLGFVAGLIAQDKINGFERLLFRATRGNMFLRRSAVGSVKDPATGEGVEKAVFVVFYAGERARQKILKICEAYGANRYPFPEDPTRQRQMHGEVTTRLRELHHTIETGDRHREGVLQQIAFNLDAWAGQVRREKAIYHTLNKLSMDASKKILVAEAWVPVTAKPRVVEALRQSAESSSTQVSTVLQPLVSGDAPPTYFRTDLFTTSFQAIVEAYGVARYREVNPAVYSIVTFPFLFAVMFGDFGHGLLMLSFAVYLVANEKKLMRQQLDEIFAMLFGGRYTILLMSIFSIFTGLIYNEFFSIPMSIFGSSAAKCIVDGAPRYDVKDLRACPEYGGAAGFVRGAPPYPFGVDPVWHGTKAELPFLNSMKMKMSILMGVVHMNLGIMMSLYNNLYFKDTLSTICEFVPQVIFLNALFGYLCIAIVYKWISGKVTDLYHVMIYMFLAPGTVDEAGYLFSGQAALQVLLLLVAFVAVPWMLVPKPMILKKRHEASLRARSAYDSMDGHHDDEEARGLMHGQAASGGHGGGGHGHGDHFDFSEVLVHQMIHTIEFVLGAVSNTASYLRLWALSLAHSQLSAVFYDRVLMMTIRMNSPLAMMIGVFVFFCATMGVLMVMESLSAFLHALRLHWVEFMNKFYRGDGYAFAPFNFEKKEGEA
ncbi:MAG: V-type ATPase, V0 complex, 116kDa subunit family [Monoraphidium minutum]|nr:MAG: V-type ATPase, V0 complex, 116kDa subunit family [Monoraphidium minutum]